MFNEVKTLRKHRRKKNWLGLNKGQMGAQFSTFRRTPRFFFLSIADDLIFELMKLAPAT